MIENNNIICFGFAEWDNPYRTNQHHIMERLSRGNRVLFIESLGLRRPTLQKKDIWRILRRLVKWFRGVRKVSDNLLVYSPLVLPFHKYAFVRAFNKLFLDLQLKVIVAKHGFTSPILWSYIPNALEYIGVWKEKLVVYHCVDELAANPLIPGDVVRKMEEEFIKQADCVFTTAKTLYESKKKLSDKVYYMPNVADYAHFSAAAKAETVIPQEAASIPGPRIGFIGAISGYKLDLDLLEYLAAKHPQWSIILIGDTGQGEKTTDLSQFKAYNNIYLLGGRPYASLPGYLKSFDVCLLPNSLNEYTKNMFPMKFFEYLSTGKPVVSTLLEALFDFKHLAYFSANKEEFERNIETALLENDRALAEKRVEAAKKFTWETRIEEMSTVINEAARK